MAIVPSSLEPLLVACGFSPTLPGQKRAMSIDTGHDSTDGRVSSPQFSRPDIVIRPSRGGDATDVAWFLAPFVSAGNCCRVPRTNCACSSPRICRRSGRTHHWLRRTGDLFREAGRGAVRLGRRSVSPPRHRQPPGNVVRGSARQLDIAETLAISAREEVLRGCGFDDRLPGARSRCSSALNSIPDRIRTCNLRLRRPTLYPVELRGLCATCPLRKELQLQKKALALNLALNEVIPNPDICTSVHICQTVGCGFHGFLIASKIPRPKYSQSGRAFQWPRNAKQRRLTRPPSRRLQPRLLVSGRPRLVRHRERATGCVAGRKRRAHQRSSHPHQ